MGIFSVTLAQAQALIFNVPAPGIMETSHLDLEIPHYLRPWHTASNPTEFFSLRGVYGIGSNGEIGLNVGPFNYRHINHSPAFVDAAVKFRLVDTHIGTGNAFTALHLIAGDSVGIGFNNTPSGHVRNIVYMAGSMEFLSTGTRISAGPYYATRDIFDAYARTGAQVTFEQHIPLVNGLTLAADWYSGNGGLFTPGFTWNNNRFSAGIGYGLANTGHKDDLVTLWASFQF